MADGVRSLLSDSRPSCVRLHGRTSLGWLFLLSVSIHLVLLLVLLTSPSNAPEEIASEPLSVEIVAEQQPAAGLPALMDATVAPVDLARPVQPAQIPPEPEPILVQSVPPVQQAEVLPSPPAPSPEVPLASPVQQAEIPLSTPEIMPEVPSPPPVPRPEKTTPPSKPAPVQVRPRFRSQPPVPPQRVAARATPTHAASDPAGSANSAAGQNAANYANGPNSGVAWMGKLKQWWDLHSFYPREASQTDEGGSVRVRIAISADGQVMSIQIVQGSGSTVLDAAAVAVFRNARLSPPLVGSPAQAAEVVVTLHYRPANGG